MNPNLLPCQSLLNALEAGTILPIHRHTHTAETYILLRGKFRFFYNDNKDITEEEVLDVNEGNYGTHIPIGVWHSMEVRGTLLFSK